MMFTFNKLTEDEIIAGSILTSLQKQVLQNRICELAEGIVRAPSSRADETYFDKLNMQKGQLAEISAMLDLSATLEQQQLNKE